ncbi:hypothetical protein ACP70R_021434 [Stipagrostis hirtigluma subsp. patula]
MERDLLSQFTGDGAQRPLVQDRRPPPDPSLSLRVGSEEEQRHEPLAATIHGHVPQRAQAAATVVAPPPPSRVPAACRVASSVGEPGCTPPRQRPDLPAGATAPPPAHVPRASYGRLAPQRPPPGAAVPDLQLPVVGPAAARPEHRDACGLCARLLQGVASDLDRARAQVALLTCENESLRYRLMKRDAAAAAPATHPHGAGLRCRACRVGPATVMLVPHDHLCLCARCSHAARRDPAIACPVCRAAAEAPR